jgi:hypothetical protein
VWQLKAAEGARRAIRALPADASRAEVEAAAAGAVANVIQEYEHQERSQRLVSSVVLHLSGETWEEREEAKEAVAKALAATPPSASDRDLERVREEALKPFRARIAIRQEQAVRKDVVSSTCFKLPYQLDQQERAAAVESVRIAIEKLPLGASRDEIEKTRDAALELFLRAREAKYRKVKLLDEALREILPYLEQLSREWEFDTTTQAVAEDLKEPIRKQLEKMLVGDEPAAEVKKRVHRLVRQELDG